MAVIGCHRSGAVPCQHSRSAGGPVLPPVPRQTAHLDDHRGHGRLASVDRRSPGGQRLCREWWRGRLHRADTRPHFECGHGGLRTRSAVVSAHGARESAQGVGRDRWALSYTFLVGDCFMRSIFYDIIPAIGTQVLGCMVRGPETVGTIDDHDYGLPKPDFTPNGCGPGGNAFGGFGSAHTGGANFVFVDGSVRALSYQTSPRTWILLAVRDDGQSIAEGF